MNGVQTLQFISIEELMPVLKKIEEGQLRENEYPPVMTIRQLAAYLQVSEQTVRNKIEKENLPVSKKCGDPRFIKSDIDAWLRGLI